MNITKEAVEARVAEFARERDALPDIDATAMSPAEQRVIEQRRTVLGRLLAKVPTTWASLTKADARIADLSQWAGGLQAVRADFELQLGTLDPARARGAYEERATYQLQERLRFAVKAIDIGWTYDHNSRVSVPAELEAALGKWGVRPLPGKASVFDGRMSLANTERRLVELRAERAALAQFLERELSHAQVSPEERAAV
jgi:hypothetical protein